MRFVLPAVVLPVVLPAVVLPAVVLPAVVLPAVVLPTVVLPAVVLPTVVLPTVGVVACLSLPHAATDNPSTDTAANAMSRLEDIHFPLGYRQDPPPFCILNPTHT